MIGIESGPAGPIVVVRVTGEIDMLTLPHVRTALAAALDPAPRHLVIDLAAVRFCCVRGFVLLADVVRAARDHGVVSIVCGVSTHQRRVAALLWADDSPFIDPAAAATIVGALRGDAPVARTTDPTEAAETARATTSSR